MPAKKYAWDDWFGRKSFNLRHGKHYSCCQASIVQQVRNAAQLRGISVHIQDHRNSVKVQVLGRGGNPASGVTAIAQKLLEVPGALI